VETIEAVPTRRVRLIEVYADVLCPFTHVGLRRLVAGRDALDRRDVVIRAHAWPLEIVNGAPVEADLVVEEVDALRSTVAANLFQAFDGSSWPSSSLPALALAARAYRVCDRVGERVSLSLRDALFERGRDIADPGVLAAIASACDIELPEREDEAAVLTDLEQGRARGVVGSPHFFVDGEGFFCPNLQIERVEGQLFVAVDRAGLADFLARCFGPGAAETS